MEFVQLKTELRNVNFADIRTDDNEYFEAVLKSPDLGLLISRLDDSFGSRAWPSGQSLSGQAQKIVNDCGGIRKGQTLYFQGDVTCSVFVMLWPWQDGEHITLKAGMIKGIGAVKV